MSTTSPDENRRNRFFPIVQKVVIIPALAFGLNVGTGGAPLLITSRRGERRATNS